MNKNGFTLIELIMIIVLIGVVFPLILAPFLTAAKEGATPAYISQLTMLAKGVMEEEIDDTCTGNFTNVDKVTNGGTYSITIPATITPSVVRQYCTYDNVSKSFTCGGATQTNYLNISVTVQDTTASGPAITISALKVPCP